MNEMLLVAELAGVRIALPAEEVRSVIEVAALTPVPLAPPHIAGLTAVRSQAITVIESRAALGLPPRSASAEQLAVVIMLNGLSYALLLDGVSDVKSCTTEPVPVSGGYGEGWDHVALGMMELEDGPALLIDPFAFISGKDRRAA